MESVRPQSDSHEYACLCCLLQWVTGLRDRDPSCPLCRAETRLVPGDNYADADVFT